MDQFKNMATVLTISAFTICVGAELLSDDFWWGVRPKKKKILIRKGCTPDKASEEET